MQLYAAISTHRKIQDAGAWPRGRVFHAWHNRGAATSSREPRMRVSPGVQHRRMVSRARLLLRMESPKARHGDRFPRVWKYRNPLGGGTHVQVPTVQGGPGGLARRSRHRRGLEAGDLEACPAFANGWNWAALTEAVRLRGGTGHCSDTMPDPSGASCRERLTFARLQHPRRYRLLTFGRDRASVSNVHSGFAGRRARRAHRAGSPPGRRAAEWSARPAVQADTGASSADR